MSPTVTDLAHAADRLLDAIDRLDAPVCVGLDPVFARLPAALRGAGEPIEAVERFSLGVIDAVASSVPCVKPQSACFERYGSAGVAALERVCAAARAAGLVVILDAKRGDIGISAEHYAEAAFARGDVDWVTINAYLGEDGIAPFLRPGRGAFALVRTSNPGGDALQRRPLAEGGSVADAVAAIVAALGERHLGGRGYSALGAVVGATKAEDAARLRRLMPKQLLLVPGYGAQGGGAADVLPFFGADGRGAIITASRSVLYPPGSDGADWKSAVAEAAQRFAEEIRAAVRSRPE
ncbi:MAG TPA: orotidine-5'-phosphate decarboxylase [Phycisphaerales bacterium]|nr:orotidine-5'-phosphate decarboxylase [Phycisphaerales bacterium]HMP37968.1 orotidine-5'-phosphate decarboxylase [Phycisphaerales bacterium]